MKDLKQIHNILFIISILICLIFMTYWINKKEGFHEDEIFSYGSSNYKYDNLFQAASIWKTPDDAKAYLTVSSDEILCYDSVYINQVHDVHPPLFYFLVHLVSSIFLNTFSKYIIFLINAIFFIGVCIFLKKILKLYNKDYLAVPLILLYGLSMGAVSTVIFLRMYSMLTFFCIVYLYINLKILNNNFEITKKQKLELIVTTILGFLTQYYFCIYALFIFVIMLINMIIDKNYKLAFKYILYHIISAIIGVILFFRSIFHIFFSYRGVGSVNDSKNIIQQSKVFFELLFGSYSLPLIIGFAIIVIGIIYLIIKEKKFNKTRLFYFLILLVPAVLFVIAISKISPYEHLRYVMPAIPIFALCFILLLDNIDIKHVLKMAIIYSVVFCITILGIFTNKPIGLYLGYNQCISIAEKYKNLDYIYICDNSFTHINSLPEFLIYNKTMILNSNYDNFDILSKDEELRNSK